MLASLANIFRIPDLRKKVLFTLTIIALYQFGANVPVPFVNFSKVAQLEAASKSSGVLGFLNLFSGGALTRMAVFGLGIMPYITSSIIIQLLATVIPKLEQWRDQGAVGQKKLTQTTRYLTVALALMQSTGLVYLFHKGGGGLFGTTQNIDLILNYSIWRAGFIVLTLTAGTAFVMWLAELITQRGIGQGMSILIFANVVAGIPSGLNTVLQEGGRVKFATILLVSLALLVLIVFVDQGQRRIPVTFAKRVVGRKMYGGSNTYIPLKVNQAGVIPIIFASSVLYIPVLLSNIIPSAAFRTLGEPQRHPDQRLLHPHVLPLHPALHLLLRLRGLRPPPAGGHHPQAGRVHPRHPTRASRPSATWPTSSTGSPGRAPSSSARWRSPRRC